LKTVSTGTCPPLAKARYPLYPPLPNPLDGLLGEISLAKYFHGVLQDFINVIKTIVITIQRQVDQRDLEGDDVFDRHVFSCLTEEIAGFFSRFLQNKERISCTQVPGRSGIRK
jgi:hypothetical protein